MPASNSTRPILLPMASFTIAVAMFTSSISKAADLRPSTSAHISHACGMLLGLNNADEPYAACVRSLSKSASANAAAMASPPPMTIGLACGDVGFMQGTPAFEQCEADLRATLENLNLNSR